MDQRQAWDFLKTYGINPRRIPNDIAAQAVELIQRIESGAQPYELRGERLRFDRSVISIPIGYRWRLVVEQGKRGLVVKHLLSHEDYNKLVANTGR